MAIVYDHAIAPRRTTMYYTPHRENRLWFQFIHDGVPFDVANANFAKMAIGFCRVSDGKWKRSFGDDVWSDDYVSVIDPLISWAHVEGQLGNGQPAIQEKGLAYLAFKFSQIGCTYEEAQEGFILSVWDHGALWPGNPFKYFEFIDIYNAWDERRSKHTTANTFGRGVPLMPDAIIPEVIAAAAIEQDAFAADAITSAAIADGTIQESKFADDAISARVIADGAIDAAAFAAGAIGSNAIADGSLTEPKFGDDAISARVIADNAIDAAAIAEAAVNAIEFGDLASEEIADYVWNRLASTQESDSNAADTMGKRLAALSRSVLRWDNPALTTQADAKVTIVANAANAAGRFIGPDVPSDLAADPQWAGNKCVLWTASTNSTTACSIVALLNDGNDNYFQLKRNLGGSTNIDVAAGDRLYFTGLVGLTVPEIFDEPLYPNHASPGTLGDAMLRMLGLRQHNMQIKYSNWNAAGTPTEGTIFIYASKQDLDADPNITGAGAIGKYAFTGTFDPQTLRPLTYTSAVDPNV